MTDITGKSDNNKTNLDLQTLTQASEELHRRMKTYITENYTVYMETEKGRDPIHTTSKIYNFSIGFKIHYDEKAHFSTSFEEDLQKSLPLIKNIAEDIQEDDPQKKKDKIMNRLAKHYAEYWLESLENLHNLKKEEKNDKTCRQSSRKGRTK